MDIVLYPKIRSKNKCAKKSSLHTYESTDFSFFTALVPLTQAWLVLNIYAKSYSQNVLIFKVFPQRRDMKNQSDLSIAFSTDFLYQSRSGRRHKRREKWDVCTFICMYTTLVSALVMFGYHMICRLISKVISWYMGNHLFVQ